MLIKNIVLNFINNSLMYLQRLIVLFKPNPKPSVNFIYLILVISGLIFLCPATFVFIFIYIGGCVKNLLGTRFETWEGKDGYSLDLFSSDAF